MPKTNKQNIIAGLFEAFEYESLTIGTSAISLTPTKYRSSSDNEKAKRAVITCENAPIRYRYDGGAPTSTEGHTMNPMDAIVLNSSQNIANFKAIRKGATDGKIFITYEG